MFHNGNMYVVSRTQRTLEPVQSALRNLKEGLAHRADQVEITRKELPEQISLIFASDAETIPSSVFMILAEERKVVIQWERVSKFNRQVKTVTYVQRMKQIQTSNARSQYRGNSKSRSKHLQVTTTRTVW